MALTRDYKQTIQQRAKRDPNFASLLMNEAVTSFLAGEPDTARVLRRFRAPGEMVHVCDRALP